LVQSRLTEEEEEEKQKKKVQIKKFDRLQLRCQAPDDSDNLGETDFAVEYIGADKMMEW